MTRKELLAFLITTDKEATDKHSYLFSSNIHNTEDIYDCIYTLLSEYWDQEDDIDNIDDIIDDLTEVADSQTPIYYADIAKFFSKNWSAVDSFVEEIGIDSKNFDIMKLIQGAYCYTLEQEARQALEEFIDTYNETLDTTF